MIDFAQLKYLLSNKIKTSSVTLLVIFFLPFNINQCYAVNVGDSYGDKKGPVLGDWTFHLSQPAVLISARTGN